MPAMVMSRLPRPFLATICAYKGHVTPSVKSRLMQVDVDVVTPVSAAVTKDLSALVQLTLRLLLLWPLAAAHQPARLQSKILWSEEKLYLLCALPHRNQQDGNHNSISSKNLDRNRIIVAVLHTQAQAEHQPAWCSAWAYSGCVTDD